VNRFIITLGFSFLLLFGSIAYGQHQGDLSPEELYGVAVKAAREGDVVKACGIWLEIAEQLESKVQRLEVQTSLGFAYAALERMPEAWHHFDLYVRAGGGNDVEAVKSYQLLEKKLAKEHFKIEFNCDPEGTLLQFGTELPVATYRCPLTWWLTPGEHIVIAQREGYNSATVEVQMPEGGGKLSHQLTLTRMYGDLVLEGPPECDQVYLDGKPCGTAPISRKVAAGNHHLSVRRDGKVLWEQAIVVQPNRELSFQVSVPAPEASTEEPRVHSAVQISAAPLVTNSSNLVEWGLVSGGVVGIVTGGTLLYIAAQTAEGLPSANYDREYDNKVLPLEIPAWSLLAGGTIAAAVGTAMLVFGDEDDPAAVSALGILTPVVVPISGGIGFTWELSGISF